MEKKRRRGASMEIEAWRGEMQEKKKTLQKTLLKLSAHFLCKVFLQERVENEVERRGRNDMRGGMCPI